MEVLITLFYWNFIYDPLHPELPFPLDVIEHIIPITILTLDFLMNTIPFYMRHLPLCIMILLIYGCINMYITLSSGKAIYDILKWTDIDSWIIVISLTILEIVAFSIFVCLANFKQKIFFRHELHKILNEEVDV
jgi:hypothetical protein